MRIGIDARFLTHPQHGGFKTYTENLIAALAEIDHTNEYVLFLDREPDQGVQLPEASNFAWQVVPGEAPMFGMVWREQVGLVRHVRQVRLDLLHSPCLTAPLWPGCPLAVTIHDMIWLHPERFRQSNSLTIKRRLMEWYFRYLPQAAIKHATLIFSVSQAAKDSIVDHFQMDERRIVLTPAAASSRFRKVDDVEALEAVRSKYGLPSNFILAIGSADPRKNLQTLIRAYAQLPAAVRAEHKLALVWTHSLLAHDMRALIERLGMAEDVLFLEGVSNDDLVLLYNAAAMFVFPSRYEGFGLPPLEAMACGTPVAAADNSSIPEIVGDAALLFQAEDVGAVADAILRVLTDKPFADAMRAKGLQRAAGFSWHRCAERTLEGYRKVSHQTLS
jgi:glycosyltransferase involved in cell wall biosynthesis